MKSGNLPQCFYFKEKTKMYRFIVNPGSGSGNGKKLISLINEYMSSKEIPFEICETARKGHAKQLSEEFKGERIIAIGGDGTFHEVLNGLDTENCGLGFIPCGRGNDFAEAFGLSKKPTEALNAAINGEPTDIDYIQLACGLRCLNIGGTGLDVSVLERVENKRDTKLTYLMPLIYCISHFTPYELDVTSGSETKHYSCIMVGVCNGRQFGGGMKISPNSSFNDGKLNIIAVELPKNGRIMRALMGFTNGKHLDKPYTHHFECEQVKISSPFNYPIELDGEIYKDVVLDCKVVKGGLKTFK